MRGVWMHTLIVHRHSCVVEDCLSPASLCVYGTAACFEATGRCAGTVIAWPRGGDHVRRNGSACVGVGARGVAHARPHSRRAPAHQHWLLGPSEMRRSLLPEAGFPPLRCSYVNPLGGLPARTSRACMPPAAPSSLRCSIWRSRGARSRALRLRLKRRGTPRSAATPCTFY